MDYNVFIEKASILPCDWIHPAVKNPGNNWQAYIKQLLDKVEHDI